MPNILTKAKDEVEDIRRFIQILKIIVCGLRNIVQQINDLDKPAGDSTHS